MVIACGRARRWLGLLRPYVRIAARAAGRRDNRHLADIGRWCPDVRVDVRGTQYAVTSRELVAQVAAAGRFVRQFWSLRRRRVGHLEVGIRWTSLWVAR